MIRACHEHDIYLGRDSWDAECCMCSGNACRSVTADDELRHSRYETQRAWRVALTPALPNPFETESWPF